MKIMKTHYDEFYETFSLYEHLCIENRYDEAEEAYKKVIRMLKREQAALDRMLANDCDDRDLCLS